MSQLQYSTVYGVEQTDQTLHARLKVEPRPNLRARVNQRIVSPDSHQPATTIIQRWFQERGRIRKFLEGRYTIAHYPRRFLCRPAFSSNGSLATSFNTDHQSQSSAYLNSLRLRSWSYIQKPKPRNDIYHFDLQDIGTSNIRKVPRSPAPANSQRVPYQLCFNYLLPTAHSLLFFFFGQQCLDYKFCNMS